MLRRLSPWIVEIAESVDAFAREWTILAGADNATPFQNIGLMRLFFRHVAAKGIAKPVIALVRDKAGAPVAILPLMQERRNGLTWLRTDARPLDYCAPIFSPRIGPAEARTIMKAVLAAVPGADLLYANKMPADFLGTPNPLASLPDAARLRFSAWLMPLSGLSEADVLDLQHQKQRSNLRRRRKKLEVEHRRHFRIAIGDAITADDYATFLEMRRNRAEEKSRNDILNDPQWRDFYTALARNEAAPCLPWMAWLSADDEPIAVLLGITDGHRAIGLMPASKGGPWKTFSPGLQLFEESLLYFRACGTGVFDLSLGDMPYKAKLGCTEVPFYDALFSHGIAGALYRLGWRVKMAIRSRMKRIAEE